MAHPLGSPSYVNFGTSRRSGEVVATPVWFAPTGEDGVYVFTTGANSGKVKRIRNNPSVEVAACSVRGQVAPGTPTYRGTAELVTEPAADHAARATLRRRYGLQFRAMEGLDALRRLIGRPADDIVVRVTLTTD